MTITSAGYFILWVRTTNAAMQDLREIRKICHCSGCDGAACQAPREYAPSAWCASCEEPVPIRNTAQVQPLAEVLRKQSIRRRACSSQGVYTP